MIKTSNRFVQALKIGDDVTFDKRKIASTVKAHYEEKFGEQPNETISIKNLINGVLGFWGFGVLGFWGFGV